MWVRGLKLKADTPIEKIKESHPMWVRGLKLICGIFIFLREVAPYVGAWIETKVHFDMFIRKGCRTLCGCVD